MAESERWEIDGGRVWVIITVPTGRICMVDTSDGETVIVSPEGLRQILAEYEARCGQEPL